MSDLFAVTERCRDRPMDFEDYLAREKTAPEAEDHSAPGPRRRLRGSQARVG